LKKRSKKLLLIAGIFTGNALNRHRAGAMNGTQPPKPAGAKNYFFSKKVTSY
jgi:hypothetical protein